LYSRDHRRSAQEPAPRPRTHRHAGGCEGSAAGRRRRLPPPGPRSRVDDELLTLLKQRPNVFFALTLFAPRLGTYSTRPRWLAESARIGAVSPEEVARLADVVAAAKPEQIEAAREEWARLARNVAKLNAAGRADRARHRCRRRKRRRAVRWAEHVELEHMVAAGLTPAQAIVAAHRHAAAVLGLDRLGTSLPARARTSSSSIAVRSQTSP
jgi:hypothetical protein